MALTNFEPFCFTIFSLLVPAPPQAAPPPPPEDDDPPPPPEWIDEHDTQVVPEQPRAFAPQSAFSGPPTSVPPKFGPPKVPVGMPSGPPPSQLSSRPLSSDMTGALRPTGPPPAQPPNRPVSMAYGATPVQVPPKMSSTGLVSPPSHSQPPKMPMGQLPKMPMARPPSGPIAPAQPSSTSPPPTAVPKSYPPPQQFPPNGMNGMQRSPSGHGIPSGPAPVGPTPTGNPGLGFNPSQSGFPQNGSGVGGMQRSPSGNVMPQGAPPKQPTPPVPSVAQPANVQPKVAPAAFTPMFGGAGGTPKFSPMFAPPGPGPARPPSPPHIAKTLVPEPYANLPQYPAVPAGIPQGPPPSVSRPNLAVPGPSATAASGSHVSPRSARKLHELLPAGIPPTAPNMPVAAPLEPFPLRFLVGKASETRMVTCSPGASVIEVLTEAMFELMEFADDDFITYHLLCGDEKETIDNSAVVSDSIYVQECLARGVAPSVLLKPSNTLTDLDDLAYDAPEMISAEDSAQASMEADLGFKLPEYAYTAHRQSNPEPVAPAVEPTPVVEEPVFVDDSSPFDATDAFDTPETQAFSPPAVAQSIPAASAFSPPSNAPTPAFVPPSFVTPKQASPLQNNRAARAIAARPSVNSLAANRRSIFEHPAMTQRVTPASRHSNIDTTFKARFSLPGDSQKWVILTLQSDDTIAGVKIQLTANLRDQGVDLPVERYIFKLPGASFLTNEAEKMKGLPYVHNCLMRGSEPMFVVLEKTSDAAKRIKKNNVEIGALIGRPMSWVQGDDEITSFRQAMTRLRYFERQKSNATQAKDRDVRAGLALHIGALATPTGPNNSTLVNLGLELMQVKKKVPVKADETAAQFIQGHVEKYYHKQGKTTKQWDEFILKPPGIAEFIYGPYAFHAFDYVRECIAKNKPVELMLVELSDVIASRQSEPSAIAVSTPASPSMRFPLSQSTSSSNIASSGSSSNLAPSTEESLEDESFLLEDPSIKYDHAEVSVGKRPAERMACISIWDLQRKFRIRLVGVENVSPISNSFVAAYTAVASSSKVPTSCDDCPLYMYLTAELYHGGEMIAKPFVSSIVPASNNPRWHEWAEFDISLSNLPRAVRVCLTAWVAKKPVRAEFNDIALSWVNMQLFDYKHELRAGPQVLKMWPDEKANPIGTTVQYDGKNPSVLYLQLETFQLPVVFPTETGDFPPYPVPTSMTNQEQARLLKISESDPLYRMTKHDKHLMWKYREFCKSRPKALPKFLASVPMADARAVQEMHRLLRIWAPIAPIDALELLDSKFADAIVREYAVRRLEELSREDLLDYLLQLVQVLKYEPYHRTAFADMLVRAALANKSVGHHFFWYLKSEIHVPEISERFGLLLEAYLRGCGPHRAQLASQNDMQLKFVAAANMIKPLKDGERLGALRAELQQVSFPRVGIGMPLNPRIEVNGIRVEKCKYMDSKKLPLWLVFQNADPKGADRYIIFKSGDDLRQDMLTLQMIRIMDHLWKKNDLDFQLNAYGCIATGDEVGMIEVVLNAMTTAAITNAAGGATAAFRDDPIDNWIREQNPTDGAYRLAKEKFIYSCAGYCVATYVLGIGDRHNDNVMLTKDGRLFHIDFGHFLGNYKKKFGVKRERAPFVFTPDFAYVMGGKDSPDFMKFLDLCARAYNVLRRNANIFINLFAMMLSTGIPELRTADDIEYLRSAFALDLNEQQAAQRFNQLVYEAMSTRTTQINNAIHIWAHKD